MKVYIAGVIVAVIVSSHDALVSSEMLSGKFHTDFLRNFRCQTMLVPVLLGERDDEVMTFHVSFFSILTPVLVCNLTVRAV